MATQAQINAALADPGASGPGGIYNQIRAQFSAPSAPSGGGGGGGGGGGTSAPSSVAPGSYQTINGPRTLQQMQQELANVGYGGPTDSASILSTYGRTSGQAVQPIMSGAPGTATSAAPGATATAPDYSGALAQFAAQTSGVTQAQLAQQKAEFDAQLQFARDQMTQLGIPQLQINQALAALQQKAFDLQVGQAMGTYQGQPTEAAKEFQATLAQQMSQFEQTFGLQQGQLSGVYQGAPTEAAKEFQQNLALQQGQLGQQYLATAAQLQGPQNTFQLSNYLRGAQGNPNVPTYLQNLANNTGMATFQGPGTTPPTANTVGGLAQQLAGQASGTPGWDYAQTLGTMQGIANRGAQALAPGALERLTPEELQAFGSGLGAVGGSLPSFLQQYQQSRVGQQAAGMPALA
jgi:hypothetical protein